MSESVSLLSSIPQIAMTAIGDYVDRRLLKHWSGTCARLSPCYRKLGDALAPPSPSPQHALLYGHESGWSGPLGGVLTGKQINKLKKQTCNFLSVMKWSLRILKYFLDVHYYLIIPTIHLPYKRLSIGKGKGIFQGVHSEWCITQLCYARVAFICM